MAERVASVPLEAGLYVLRYVQALSSYGAPQVFVRPSPGSEGIVSVMSPPGERDGSISAPGGCIVVRAERASSLHVTITSTIPGGGTEAELRLESLTADARAGEFSEQSYTQPQAGGAMAPSMGSAAMHSMGSTGMPVVELMGHVSRRGDVGVTDGAWVAGPESPAPIEGLEMRLTGVAGAGLEYQVQVGGGGGSWTNWMPGGFAGTRGQARPLLGARVRLVGAQAARYQIEAEALFLGASVKRLKGQVVEIVSDSGVDPMVGLKLAIAPAVQAAAPARPAPPQRGPAAPSANPVPPARSGRVRVFRSAGIR